MTPEDIKNYAAAIQSVFVSAAVLIGGAWAIYKFFSLKEVSRASAELRKRQIDAKQSALLNIDVNITVGPKLDDYRHYTIIDVVIHNPSTTTEILKWTEDNVTLTSVSENEKGSLATSTEISLMHGSLNGEPLVSSSIAAGEKENYSFAAKVSPGLYLFEFQCEVINALDDAREAHAKAGVEIDELMWSSPRFFQVPLKSEA